MSVTIHDVAKAAEVSIATVSRVLNGKGLVSEEKQARVRAAVKALKYIPNPAASRLPGKKTQALGILVPYVAGEFFSAFLAAIDQAAHRAGYFIQISCLHYNTVDLKVVLKHMYRRVDGLIVMAPQMSAREVLDILPEPTETVFVNTETGGASVHTINFQNKEGAYLMTKHLIDLGHRRIAMVTGSTGAKDAELRLMGYRQALADFGIPHDPRWEVNGDFTTPGGYHAAQHLLNLSLRPTAIFCANDTSAFGVLRALREHKVRIPEDIAIGGFDGTFSTEYTVPPLTTAAIPVADLGRLAVERLVQLIEGTMPKQLPQIQSLPAKLLVRGSTDPALVEPLFGWGRQVG